MGAGFCGTVLTANLLRRPWPVPTRVLLIERGRRFARGIAYQPHSFPFLLNVPAGRMSADSRRPDEFLEFARRRHPDAEAADFLPRALYGDYLEDVLSRAESSAAPNAWLERVQGAVCGISQAQGSGGFQVALADGRLLDADDVVLAIGNPAPSKLLELQGAKPCARCIDNPWQSQIAFHKNESVLLLGTGLTMIDMAMAAAAQGVSKLHAISRHGLAPLPQPSPCSDVNDEEIAAVLSGVSLSLRSVVKAIRTRAREKERMGGSWREVVAAVRDRVPLIWQRFCEKDRRRFLRHVRAYWDIHRHRVPQAVHTQIEQLRSNGLLDVQAGRILELTNAGSRIDVIWRPRGAAQPRLLTVDRVIDCTGSDAASIHSREPVVQSLLDAGTASVDNLHLGLRTANNGALVGAYGQISMHLFCLGPLLRAEHWEATAVPELRKHAERLAGHLAAAAGARALKTAPVVTAT